MLSEGDVREMVGILSEVAAMESDLAAKRRVLLEGLARLIDADRWVCSLSSPSAPGKMPAFAVRAKSGFTDEQFSKFMQIHEHPEVGKLSAPFFAEFAEKKTHLTRLRQQIYSDEVMNQSALPELFREADFAPLVVSMRPTANGEASAVVMYRKFDRPVFTERESRIAHIMLTEVPWLHEGAWPDRAPAAAPRLSPRLNTVTNLLLQGASRKQMAAEMGISVHTLNGYVKEIYARFEVHSQHELIRSFADGDGGDCPPKGGQ